MSLQLKLLAGQLIALYVGIFYPTFYMLWVSEVFVE